MWTETDTYLENEYNKFKKAEELLEKYKDTDNEEIKFLVEYTKELIKQNKWLDKERDEYFQRMYKYRYIARDFISYANMLEKDLKIEYRINHKENADRFFNSKLNKRPKQEID